LGPTNGGHDKLNRTEFQIRVTVDDGSGKLLDAWLAPSNRHAQTIGYSLLCQVETLGGKSFVIFCCPPDTPIFTGIQTMGQKRQGHVGSSMRFGMIVSHFSMSLALMFRQGNLTAARSYLLTSIFRAFTTFPLSGHGFVSTFYFGDDAVLFFEQGIHDGIHNDQPCVRVMLSPIRNGSLFSSSELCNWLWAKVLRKELRNYFDPYNRVKTRKDRNKCGSSGVFKEPYICLSRDMGR